MLPHRSGAKCMFLLIRSPKLIKLYALENRKKLYLFGGYSLEAYLKSNNTFDCKSESNCLNSKNVY